MTTIKDFAASVGVSESIVYRHIRNHKAELGDRVYKDRGRTFLTDEGEAYISALIKRPGMTSRDDRDVERIRELQEDLKVLREQLKAAADAMTSMTAANNALIAQNAEYRRLEAENDQKVQEAQKNAQEAHQSLAAAHTAFESTLADKNREIEQREEEIARLQQLPVLDYFKMRFAKGKKKDGRR